jgi:hypothetical protein
MWLTIDGARDVSKHSPPRWGMFLAPMLPEEIQQERVF